MPLGIHSASFALWIHTVVAVELTLPEALRSFLNLRLKPKAAAAPRAGRGPGTVVAAGAAWAHTETKLPG